MFQIHRIFQGVHFARLQPCDTRLSCSRGQSSDFNSNSSTGAMEGEVVVNPPYMFAQSILLLLFLTELYNNILFIFNVFTVSFSEWWLFSTQWFYGNPQLIMLLLLSTYQQWVTWKRNPRFIEKMLLIITNC